MFSVPNILSKSAFSLSNLKLFDLVHEIQKHEQLYIWVKLKYNSLGQVH